MKKILLFSCLATVLLLTGCEKEKEFSIVGKVYACQAYSGTDIYNNPYTAYYVFRFRTDSTLEHTWRKDSPTGPYLGGSNIDYGVYSLNYPNMHLEWDDYVLGEKAIDVVFLDEKTFRDEKSGRDYILQE